MTYKTLLQLVVCSQETEDGLPLKEVSLSKHVELPIPPQPGLWLRDQSANKNAIVESVAVHGQSLIAYLVAVKVSAPRVDEVVTQFKEIGWR